jgi:hypothetical protein
MRWRAKACNAITFMSIIMFLTHSSARTSPFHQLIRFFSRDQQSSIFFSMLLHPFNLFF